MATTRSAHAVVDIRYVGRGHPVRFATEPRDSARKGGRMDAAQAISLVLREIRNDGLDYPTADLTADPFWGGWCVYAPVMVADRDPDEDVDEPLTRSAFLVSHDGRIEEVSSTGSAEKARERIAEACLWFAAMQPPVEGQDTFAGPSHPDFSRYVRPRPPRTAAAHDRQAVEAFARALAHEPDFPRWLINRLREAAGLLGHVGHLVAKDPDSVTAERLMEFIEPEDDEDFGDLPAPVWQTWPPVDPASLPDVDTAGWLLVQAESACEYLEDVEDESDAAARLADTLDGSARQAPPWLACGVAELVPGLVAIRRDARFDADLDAVRRLAAEHEDEDVLDTVLAAPSPDDPDVQALLRIAIDAHQRHREVIKVDAAATAAYRRFLDRLGLAFPHHDWLGAMLAAEGGHPTPFAALPSPSGPAAPSAHEDEDEDEDEDDARYAIGLVVEWIRSRGLDYPTEGLVADRFEAGWSVYAPVEVDETDPMAFLDLPVGRSVFLVGDSGRIKETSSSVPPGRAEEEFIAEERAASGAIDIEWAAMRLQEEGAIQDFTIVDTPPEEAIAAQASELIEPIVRQLALLGPAGWRRFDAVFTLAGSAEAGRVRFRTDRPNDEAAVPEPIMALVRRQREVAARMPAGPWWRLLLTVADDGETAVEYDYGDRPLPPEDLLPAEHYRDDLAAHPRTPVPAWLADHVADQGALETKVAFRRLHADSRQITYGDRSIALDQLDWVRYHSTHVTTKRFLGLSTHHALWYFSAGSYPATPATTIDLEFPTDGKNAPPPDAWAFLVELSRRHLEPRLVARLADRVRRGELLDVAGVQVHRDGILTAQATLPWAAISDVRVAEGRLSVYRADAPEPVVSVPLTNANAVLIPALLTAITS